MGGLNVVLYVDEKRYEEISKGGFSSALGYWFWNIGVMGTPMDTGNARRSVVLAKNSPRHIRIAWDLFLANYVEYLEKGIGPVKKYKNFISVDINGAIMEETIAWILTGKEPVFSARGGTPFVELVPSKHKPFSMERVFLRQANMNTQSITAKARQQISMIRHMQNPQNAMTNRLRGERVETSTKKGVGDTRLNRNISGLQMIYNKRKEDMQSLL